MSSLRIRLRRFAIILAFGAIGGTFGAYAVGNINHEVKIVIMTTPGVRTAAFYQLMDKAVSDGVFRPIIAGENKSDQIGNIWIGHALFDGTPRAEISLPGDDIAALTRRAKSSSEKIKSWISDNTVDNQIDPQSISLEILSDEAGLYRSAAFRSILWSAFIGTWVGLLFIAIYEPIARPK